MEVWIVDGLIGFLQSPGWTSPINNFIDKNCVVFNPGDEDKFVYVDIHNHYNTLVDQLLSKFTAELGITAEQLGHACVQSQTLGALYQKPLEQVLAAENVVLFNSLMVQRNIDLEFQALELLKTQLGHAPDAYDPNLLPPTAPLDKNLSNEEEIIQQALKESKREFEAQKSLDEEEMEKLINIATNESLRLLKASEKEKQLKFETSFDKKKSTLEKQSVKTSPKTTQQAPLVSMSPDSEKEKQPKFETSFDKKKTTLEKQSVKTSLKTTQQAPLVSMSPMHAVSTSTSEAASMWLRSAKNEYEQAEEQQKVSVQLPSDLKSREAYLKRQRDHLLKIKRQARARDLDSYNTTKKKTPPMSRPATHTSDQSAGSVVKPIEHAIKEKKVHTGVLCNAIARKMKEYQH